MKILFLANRFPYPPYRGDKLKIFNLAKQLSERHTLYLITFIDNKDDYNYLPELEKYFDEIKLVYMPHFMSAFNSLSNVFSETPFQINYFRSNRLKKVLEEFISQNEIDVIHTQHLRMAQYTAGLKNVSTVLDLPDAYSMYWKRRASQKKNPLINFMERSEYKKVLKYEKIICEFDLTLVCSEEDKNYLIAEHELNNIEVLENGVDTDQFGGEEHDYFIDDQIIFTGNMTYHPNIDAAVYFAEEIFPEVLKKFPNVKFKIAGQNPTEKILKLQSENIIVTGFVKSLSDEYSKSSIAVSPVRVGAGSMNKVLEPMSMGVPVVSSEIGFKGLGAKAGLDILLAENKSEFINSVCNLLSHAEYRRYIGMSGREVIQNNLSWEKIALKLEDYFYSVADHRKEEYIIHFENAV
ncbi:MAG TPA: glycosyltransferase [Ignavibacteria bacterium]|nr:glycosyltransferase [Ignavibacteria bacterium]